MDETTIALLIYENSDQSFRFCETQIYDKELSGRGVKEMDFAWSVNGDLCLMEVYAKDVFKKRLKKEKVNEFLKEIAGKITDSLFMLSAVWLETEWGRRFSKEIPEGFHTIPDNRTRRIRLFVLFVGEGDYKCLNDNIHKAPRIDQLKNLVYGKSQMLDIGINQFTVLTPKLARELLIGKDGSPLIQ